MIPKISLNTISWLYLNLAYRPDRNVYVQDECARVGIAAQRFNALLPTDYRGPRQTVAQMAFQPGRIGCYLSHLALINGARNTEGVLGILEDDVVFCDDFPKRMQYIEEHFDKPWDMFFLGSTYHVNPPVWHKADLGRDFEQTDVKYIHRVYGTWNTYAYLVNRQSAGRIADLMYANAHRAKAVDHLFILIEPMLNCYCFSPGMAFQRDDFSDITNSFTKFSDFLPMGPYVFTRYLEDFDYDNYNWAEGTR